MTYESTCRSFEIYCSTYEMINSLDRIVSFNYFFLSYAIINQKGKGALIIVYDLDTICF